MRFYLSPSSTDLTYGFRNPILIDLTAEYGGWKRAVIIRDRVNSFEFP